MGGRRRFLLCSQTLIFFPFPFSYTLMITQLPAILFSARYRISFFFFSSQTYLHTFGCVCAVLCRHQQLFRYIFFVWVKVISLLISMWKLSLRWSKSTAVEGTSAERTNQRKRKNKRGEKKGPAIVFDSSKVILFNSQSWKTINHSSASPRSIIVYAVHRRYVHIRPKRGIVNLSGGHHHRVMDDRDPRDQGALAPPTTFSFHSSTTLK